MIIINYHILCHNYIAIISIINFKNDRLDFNVNVQFPCVILLKEVQSIAKCSYKKKPKQVCSFLNGVSV